MDKVELTTRFTFHPAVGDQPDRYQAIRDKAGELAVLISELSPESREQSLAITACEEASMWANAAIARRS
jgi:hypothetical protein